jgi:AcrR family transcriptional regulator
MAQPSCTSVVMARITERKASRRTRQRILETTLRLYNELGEPNVSTTLIATELGISSGNLYYHFKRKDDLTTGLFEAFAAEMDTILPPATWRAGHVDDAWFLLHIIFEGIWKYRFVFRDLPNLVAHSRRIESRLRGVLDRAADAAMGICSGLRDAGQLHSTDAELAALAQNIVVVAFYWLPFQSARNPRNPPDSPALARGAYQVMMLVAPFLDESMRAQFEAVAAHYVSVARRS